MRTAALLLIVLSFPPLELSAGGGPPNARVRLLQTEGNSHFASSDLTAVMQLKEGGMYSPALLAGDVAALRDLYARDGYCLAEIDGDSLRFNEDSTSVDVLISIREGERFQISSILLEGSAVLGTSEILSGFQTHPGTPLSAPLLERDMDALLSRYERIGYPFARVSVESLQVVPARSSSEEGGLRLALRVAEGPPVTIDEFRVTGNHETRPAVVVRETRISLHEKYDQDKVAKIRPRLSRLGIFSSVGEPQLYLTQAGGGLLISVEEAPSNTFDGILGYAPGGVAGEPGIVSGMVNVSFRNLFGTGRKLSARWQRDDGSTQEVALAYVEPWVINLPLNLRGGFQQRQQEGLYVRRSLELGADLLLSESLTFGGVFHHEQVIPSSGSTAVFQSRTITTGLQIGYDTRDDAVSPERGINYRTGYELGTKKLFGTASGAAGGEQTTVQRVSLDAEVFLSAFQRQVVALGIHGRQLTNSRSELGALYRFGGTNTLRGYRENEFLGSRIAWTNAEYRFLLERRAYFFGFLDTGYFYLPGDDAQASSQAFKYGYGLGVRFETALGSMGVSLAFGEGDSFSQGKIHLGLLNNF